MKKRSAWCFLLLLFMATPSSSYAQDGAFGFPNAWGSATGGSSNLFSAPGTFGTSNVSDLSRLMDFHTTVSRPLDPDDFFNHFLNPPVTEEGEEKGLLSPFDLFQTDKDVAIRALIAPGTGLGDINVTSDGDRLTVNVQKTETNEETGEDYGHVEWSRESSTRITPLPDGVEWQEMITSYEDDVLTMTFPKNE